jgi:hypothetical protein
MDDDRIVKWAPRGHIPLTCRNHPELRWSTKNIDFIGARTIFYNLDNDPKMGRECDCPIADLIPVKPEDATDVDP